MGDSPDRFRMCAACPNRHQADLAESVGEGALAERIRAAGCGWWQEGIPSVDPQLGFMASPTWTGCFAPLIPTYLIALARDAAHSAAAFNVARDRVLELAASNGEARALHELALVGLATAAGAIDDRKRQTLASIGSDAVAGNLSHALGPPIPDGAVEQDGEALDLDAVPDLD